MSVERQSTSFIRDICKQQDYYYDIINTWLVGVPTYVPNVDYPIPPLGYIPLDISTLPIAIANGT